MERDPKEAQRIPRHVAVIMDGNGRWAKKRLLPRGAGHRAGLKRMIALSEHAFKRGVRVLTLYALSVENLSRPKEELEGLFSLFREYFLKESEKLKEKGIAVRVLGDNSLLPPDVASALEEGVKKTAGGMNGTLALAIGYGARQEILSAVNEAVRKGKSVTEEDFSSLLTTKGLPELDLLIRTGRELRLSNFLLYQSAYAELYFTNKLFPDFSNGDFDRALEEFARRERRYGKV